MTEPSTNETLLFRAIAAPSLFETVELVLAVTLSDGHEVPTSHYVMRCVVTQCPPDDPDFCAFVSSVTANYHTLERATREFLQMRDVYMITGIKLAMVSV